MKKEMLKLYKKIEEIQRGMFVKDEYINKDIKNFIKELKNISLKTVSDVENKQFSEFIGKEISRLKLITLVLYTKKLESEVSDLVYLGKYLKELGDEFIEFAKEKQNGR